MQQRRLVPATLHGGLNTVVQTAVRYLTTPAELGIDLNNIRAKLIAVIDPRSKVNMHVVQDGDLFGPLSICLALGFVLLLRGQVHFGEVCCARFVSLGGMRLVCGSNASVSCPRLGFRAQVPSTPLG